MLGGDVVLSIIENKSDLEEDRQVSMKTAKEYAQLVNTKLLHTSAKLNEDSEEIFNDLVACKFVFKRYNTKKGTINFK
ncbi:unnamed protein product [Rotaria sp. Silwood2]|nr:unnamed protein product [Rotaria sp. Silwood2]CAF4436516.1 unnamed protein product [Rotaria sp. Silwood2]CAF4585188.1 unnamed protein product [Rotaria sp. Silwood2]CAF4630838.1 unnamed protein product [Rotaria sp. Silwood2]CAF4764777.1 unnamed protein product [Rotaria sp. Silwood2]